MMHRLTAIFITLLLCLQFAAADTSTLNCHAVVAEMPLSKSLQPDLACGHMNAEAPMSAVAACSGGVNYYIAIEYDIDREMSTEYFPRLGTRLTFPTKSETTDAIRRMA